MKMNVLYIELGTMKYLFAKKKLDDEKPLVKLKQL